MRSGVRFADCPYGWKRVFLSGPKCSSYALVTAFCICAPKRNAVCTVRNVTCVIVQLVSSAVSSNQSAGMYLVISFLLCPLEPMTCRVETKVNSQRLGEPLGVMHHTLIHLQTTRQMIKQNPRIVGMLENVDVNCLQLLTPHKAAIVLHDFHQWSLLSLTMLTCKFAWQGWQKSAVKHQITMGTVIITSFTTLFFPDVRVHCNERIESK